MHRNAFHWRIRDCILNQAGCWGLRIFGPLGDPVPANGEPVYGNDHLEPGVVRLRTQNVKNVG